MRSPSDSDLRAAFRRSYRASWPADYDEAMQNPVICAVVACVARQIPAINRMSVPRAPWPFRVPRASVDCGEAGHPNKPRPLDRKQLASGERPDPDDECNG